MCNFLSTWQCNGRGAGFAGVLGAGCCRNNTIIDLTEEVVEPDFSDMEKAHKEEIDALRKEVEKVKQEAKALRLDKREKFNKKVVNLKNSASDLKNAVSDLFK